MYIFLDESGQLTKSSHEKYFVIGSFSAGDPHKTAKGFRKWCSSHFPRKMRDLNEIKWSATGISDELRLKTLRYIAKLDIDIRCIYVSNMNIPLVYWKKNVLQGGLLYTDLVGEILLSYLPSTDKEIRVYCDRRKLAGILEAEFSDRLRADMLATVSSDTNLQIKMVDSTSTTNIQIADWIVGALARYLEGRHLGEECYEILKGSLSQCSDKKTAQCGFFVGSSVL